MRAEGADFLQKNAAIGDEVKRTLVDLDEISKELGKAAKAIESATGLTAKHKVRVQGLCDNTLALKKASKQKAFVSGRKGLGG
jgi:hypothetical protein